MKLRPRPTFLARRCSAGYPPRCRSSLGELAALGDRLQLPPLSARRDRELEQILSDHLTRAAVVGDTVVPGGDPRPHAALEVDGVVAPGLQGFGDRRGPSPAAADRDDAPVLR